MKEWKFIWILNLFYQPIVDSTRTNESPRWQKHDRNWIRSILWSEAEAVFPSNRQKNYWPKIILQTSEIYSGQYFPSEDWTFSNNGSTLLDHCAGITSDSDCCEVTSGHVGAPLTYRTRSYGIAQCETRNRKL